MGTHRAQAQIISQFPKTPSPLVCLLHLSSSAAVASLGFMSPPWLHGVAWVPCTSWTPMQPCPKDASPAPGSVWLMPPLPLEKWQTSALCAVPYQSSTLNAILYLGLSAKGAERASRPAALLQPHPKAKPLPRPPPLPCTPSPLKSSLLSSLPWTSLSTTPSPHQLLSGLL